MVVPFHYYAIRDEFADYSSNDKAVIAREISKNINVEFPLGKFICVTGVSGSGKSSLVFDCIYATAQSSFYETLSTYVVKNLPKIYKNSCIFLYQILYS